MPEDVRIEFEGFRAGLYVRIEESFIGNKIFTYIDLKWIYKLDNFSA